MAHRHHRRRRDHRHRGPLLHRQAQLDHRLAQPGRRVLERDRRAAETPPRPRPQPGRDGQGLRRRTRARSSRRRPKRGPRRCRRRASRTPPKPSRQLTEALTDLSAVAENYPTLRATENFQQLSRNLSELEDEIQASRRIYNSNVQSYNTDDPAVPGLDHRQPGRLHRARVLRDRGPSRARAGLGQLRQIAESRLSFGHDGDHRSDPLDLRELRVHLRPGDRRSRRRHPARNPVRGHPQGLVLPRLRRPDQRLPPPRARRGLEPRVRPPSGRAGAARVTRMTSQFGACRLDVDWLVWVRLRRLGLGPAAGRKGLLGARCSSAAAASATRTSPSRRCANRAATSGCRDFGMRGVLRLTFFKDVLVVSGSGVGGGSLGYANTLYRARPAFFEDPQWADLGDWERELAPHYDDRGADARRRRVRGDGPGRPAAAGIRRGDRRRRHLPQHPGRGLLRPARASRSPTPTSKARDRRGPAACAAAAAWSAAATGPRTRWSRTTSGSPRSSGSRSSPNAR